jgi:Secretion system C-terminal sorting domain
MIFYEYNILNKSSNNYQQFRAALFDDVELGYFADDYIGFDSSHRMGIEYNSVSPDGFGQVNYYGTHIPVVGVSFLRLPGDAPGSFVPAGNFRYYNNDFSVMGDPSSAINYNQYMRGMWRDSSMVTNDFAGYGIHSTCYGSGIACNYVYTGNPADTSQWSECAAQNNPGDRRYIMSSSNFTFNAGTSETISFALITTYPDSNNTCPNVSFDSIKIYADTAWAVYNNPLPTAVSMPSANNSSSLIAYPNPCINELCIPLQDANAYSYRVYNAIGQSVALDATLKGSVLSLNTSKLPCGFYFVQLMANNQYQRCSFVKE